MCIRPELNPQQKPMTVMISLDIGPYWVFWYLFVCFLMGGTMRLDHLGSVQLRPHCASYKWPDVK